MTATELATLVAESRNKFRQWLDDRLPSDFVMPSRERAIEDCVDAAEGFFALKQDKKQ